MNKHRTVQYSPSSEGLNNDLHFIFLSTMSTNSILNDCGSDACMFYSYPNWCNDCRVCTYCGKTLYHSGSRGNHNFDQVMANIFGGSTVVPACDNCNQRKTKKGLKEWLRWTQEKRPATWKRIVAHNRWKRHKIAQTVRDVKNG